MLSRQEKSGFWSRGVVTKRFKAMSSSNESWRGILLIEDLGLRISDWVGLSSS
jgi:hypothetical protein